MKLASEEHGAAADRMESLDLQRFLTQEHHRIHLVGVAGSGMSGLAALLIELGHTVSGSDKATTMETDRLQRLGLRSHEQHRPEHADAAELVVFSSAIKNDNPVLVSGRASGKPVVRRAEALAAIMRAKRGIVIAGMHGKTTTSAMTAHVLREGGFIRPIMSVPKFQFSERTRTGIRAANISLLKATKATVPCAASIRSTA